MSLPNIEMDETINELFSVILQSEKIAFDEKKQLNEVKAKIEGLRLRLERQRNGKKEYKERIQKLTEGVVCTTCNVHLLRSQEKYLHQRLRTLQQEITCHREKLVKLRADSTISSKSFVSKVSKFSLSFGLGQRMSTVIEGLDVKESELRAGTSHMSFHQDASTLRDRLAEQRKDLETKLREEQAEIGRLQSQHSFLLAVPDTDPEFLAYVTTTQIVTAQTKTRHK